MGDKEAIKTYWEGFSDVPSVETMMLNNNAETIDEFDRRDIWNSLPDLAGLRVVEIGSGIGRFTAALASVANHVLASDFVKSFIEKNEEDNAHLGNVSFKCADAVNLNLEPESCDFVFTNWLLMYLTDEELTQFLASVLRWLTVDGYLHIRESCSESSKRAASKVTDEVNPTHYRHVSQYLTLLNKIKIRDEQTGKLLRFEILWAKSVEVYVQVCENWRQVHMLLRKVDTVEDGNKNDALVNVDFISSLGPIPLKEKERFAQSMAARMKLWGSRSPLEPLLLKYLVEKVPLCLSTAVLNLHCNNAVGVSPFAIAERFGCKVENVDTGFQTYDFNLAEANAKGDKRLRFRFIPGVSRGDADAWQYVQGQFDIVVASMLTESGVAVERLLGVLSEKVAPGGQVFLLEKLRETAVTMLESFNRSQNFGTICIQDVTKGVTSLLLAAMSQVDKNSELGELRREYDDWLQTVQNGEKWCLITWRPSSSMK